MTLRKQCHTPLLVHNSCLIDKEHVPAYDLHKPLKERGLRKALRREWIAASVWRNNSMVKLVSLAASGLFVLALLVVLALLAVIPSFAREIVCYLILFAFLARQKPLVDTFLALGLAHRIFLGGFLIAMLAGHLIDRSGKTYPVVAWSMFTRPVEGDPVYFEYAGILEDGQQVALHFDSLFPNTLGRNTIIKMTWLAKSIAKTEPGPERQEQIAHYERTLQALGQKHNATHADNPVRTVHVWECRVPLKDYRGLSSLQRKPFWTVEIAPHPTLRGKA